jgi:UDP-glucose 4-epimerase
VRYLVTGCAGFIGSHVVERLLTEGHDVLGLDDFSTGHERFLSVARKSPRFRFLRADLLGPAPLSEALTGCDAVIHLAANADVRFGPHYPRRDLEQNTIATANLLDAMRAAGVSKLLFASTAAVYGEPKVVPTPEDAPFPVQTSLYAASKLACEGLIQSYCEAFGFQSWIFRFVSVLGERYTHGHVADFCRQLGQDPSSLRILGDGRQRKSYLHVSDCVDAMILAFGKATEKVNIFNLGSDEHCSVTESAGWICSELGLSPRLEFSGGKRGWVGDNPFVYLDCSRIRKLGWRPSRGIHESVTGTVRWLKSAPWALDSGSNRRKVGF